jgi:hypothetical protein
LFIDKTLHIVINIINHFNKSNSRCNNVTTINPRAIIYLIMVWFDIVDQYLNPGGDFNSWLNQLGALIDSLLLSQKSSVKYISCRIFHLPRD